MSRYRLIEQADIGAIYEAERLRYSPEAWARIGIDCDAMRRAFAGCPSIGIEIDGVPAGGAVLHRGELHMAVLPQYHGAWTWAWPDMLDWLLTWQDPVLARVEVGNETALRFVDAQYPRLREDHQFVTYEVSRARNHLLQRRSARRERAALRGQPLSRSAEQTNPL